MALRYRTLLAAAAAVACSGGGSSGSPAAAPSYSPGGAIPLAPALGPEKLSEAGSTLLLQLIGTWATPSHQQHPNVSITTAGGGLERYDQARARQAPDPPRRIELVKLANCVRCGVWT